jgi:hypothetical protein
MFFSGSRYASAGSYQAARADGTLVTVTRIPLPTPRAVLGWHRRGEGERLDLIAYRYLKDPAQAWILCEANDCLVPDALAAHELIAIADMGR